MNQNTHIRMWTIFGTSEGNEEVCDRHIAVQDIPAELMWQANRRHLNGSIKVVKLTFNPEVEQPPETTENPNSSPSTACPTSADSTTNCKRVSLPPRNPPAPGGFLVRTSYDCFSI